VSDFYEDDEPVEKITRRNYLFIKASMAGADPFLAVEVVSSTAIEHPEWDMDEKKTWAEWENR
jgi:Uma2 family endonuclease